MTREEIIRDVARTLFVCVYADGIEEGEIEGPRPGPGEDWMDYAPRRLEYLACGGTEHARTFPSTAFNEASAWHDRHGGMWVKIELPDPSALQEARRIVDAFELAAQHVVDRTAVEEAARIHAELSGTERFAHCLAMSALGHGVGLEDDMPPGVYLPDWIQASVPSSSYGYHELQELPEECRWTS